VPRVERSELAPPGEVEIEHCSNRCVRQAPGLAAGRERRR
jgi:hypothetical protein